MRQTTHEKQPPGFKRVLAASFLGAVIEWYDFAVFGSVAALAFGPVFFSPLGSLGGTLSAFATFAVGFLARPVGGIFFGWLGDVFGRKPTLVATILSMGGASLGIALSPSYHQAGVVGPIMLIVFRIIQGISLGGEFGGISTLLIEHSAVSKRGFVGSIAQLGGLLGPLAGTLGYLLIVSTLSKPDAQSWGWRLLFVFAAILALIGFWVRRRIEESPVFLKQKESSGISRNPFKLVFRHNLRSVLAVFGMLAGETVIFWAGSVFNISFLKSRRGFTESGSLLVTVIFLVFCTISALVSGRMSDRHGRRPLTLTAAIVGFILIYPAYYALGAAPTLVILASVAILGLTEGIFYGVQPAYFSELFPADRRYAGMSLGYQVSNAAIGGTAPILGSLFVDITDGGTWLFSMYVSFIMLFAIAGALLGGETAPAKINTMKGNSNVDRDTNTQHFQ